MTCKCQCCGNQYFVDISVPDQLWEMIKPDGKPAGAGLLCGVCIFKRIEMLGKYGHYVLNLDTLEI